MSEYRADSSCFGKFSAANVTQSPDSSFQTQERGVQRLKKGVSKYSRRGVQILKNGCPNTT
eukprot:5037249-Amphidinium_carterae.1